MNSDDTNHVVGLSIDSSSENNATSSAFSSSVLVSAIFVVLSLRSSYDKVTITLTVMRFL